jgi:hypothetical protein
VVERTHSKELLIAVAKCNGAAARQQVYLDSAFEPL